MGRVPPDIQLETTFRSFSRLGSNTVIFPAFAVIVLVTAHRCRALALALTVAVLARPVFEFFLKLLVGSDRPTSTVSSTEPGTPSPVVTSSLLSRSGDSCHRSFALTTNRRWIWWLTTAASGILIVGISASRIYLGVHWFSDIIGGLLIGWLYLTVIESTYSHHHHGRGCRSEATDTVQAGAHS